MGTTQSTSGPMPMCRAYRPTSYAKQIDTSIQAQLDVVEVFGITPWLSDTVATETKTLMEHLAKSCGAAKIPAVFAAIPKFTCANGTTLSPEVEKIYDDRLNALAPLKDQNMVYVLEPGVVASIVDGGVCRDQYKQLLIKAVTSLNTNKNAEIYLDVGFWAISDTTKLSATAQIIKDIRATTTGTGANLKLDGVALNTAGYQSTRDATALCKSLNEVAGNVNCVIDTSRNNKPQAFEWCNAKDMGIGHPPTNTHIPEPLVKYYLWNKPPGESDGECPGGRTGAMVGPVAGEFFKPHFDMLWEKGWLKENKVTDLNAAYITLMKAQNTGTFSGSEPASPASAPAPAPVPTPAPTPVPSPLFSFVIMTWVGVAREVCVHRS